MQILSVYYKVHAYFYIHCIGIFKLGFLTIFFSNAMINSYTIGVAVHVFSSQINHLLGYKVKSYPGLFNLIYVSNIDKSIRVLFIQYDYALSYKYA